MTCAALQTMGKQTVGIDIRSAGFAANKARRKGVSFIKMDAAQIGLADRSIDCVFSYNSFEHFIQPSSVLQEINRLLRPGGYIYLDFGPLYWSAKGAHQFATIHVPYVQCLFSQETLIEYSKIHNLDLIEFFWMNQWAIEQYRSLWQTYNPHFETIFYHEILDTTHVDLIYKYPACFRSKSDKFDNFLTAHIRLLFRKRV